MNIHKILETPWIYGLNQKINPFTVRLCAEIAVHRVPAKSGDAVLDIGSGIGTRRNLFPAARYTGIDINPEYVDFANRAHGGGFEVMDAGRLTFAEGSFDHALSMAVCHHLDDDTVSAMVREALRIVKPTGALHIIDAVIPVSRFSPLKRFIFENDRGRHQRTFAQMTSLLASNAHITGADLRVGAMHDVCYFALARVRENLGAVRATAGFSVVNEG